MRKILTTLVALGLTLGLLGAGISATFTDSAQAEVRVQVGQFGIEISAEAPATVNGDSVYLDAGFIQTSAPGSRPLTYTLTNIGTMPATISIAATVVSASEAFSAIAPPAGFTLAPGESRVVNGGVSWTELGNADLGVGVNVLYAISAVQ
jgi:hypothetical protein